MPITVHTTAFWTKWIRCIYKSSPTYFLIAILYSFSHDQMPLTPAEVLYCLNVNPYVLYCRITILPLSTKTCQLYWKRKACCEKISLAEAFSRMELLVRCKIPLIYSSSCLVYAHEDFVCRTQSITGEFIIWILASGINHIWQFALNILCSCV